MNTRVRDIPRRLPESSEELRDFYRLRYADAKGRNLASYDDYELMPHWISRSYQQAAFSLILRFGIPREASLLDIGCGYGCLLEMLRLGGWRGRYLGIDLVPEFVDAAKMRFADDRSAAFIEADYLGADARNHLLGYDYHVATSIFGLAYLPDFLERVISRAVSLARQGVLITCNSTRHRNAKNALRAYDPAWIIETSVNFSPCVSLIHSSIPVSKEWYSLMGVKIDLPPSHVLLETGGQHSQG